MKSQLVVLWLSVYEDIHRIGSYAGATRDKQLCLSRIDNEGLSFLTITLPSFCSDFERSLDRGYVETSDFRAFRKSGRIPAFLQGIVSRVFDLSGRLLADPDVEAIKHVRQLTLMFKKLKMPCSESRNAASLRSYQLIERELALLKVERSNLDRFKRVSRVIWSHLEFLSNPEWRPKFGPGVTADRLSQRLRRDWPFYHDRLEPYFPMIGNALCASDYEDPKVQVLTEDQENPVRVILVPKTLKGPRVIAAEPACMQFCQQALLDYTMSKVRHLNWCLPFDSQEQNRHMSRDLAFATLDLKDASDRVHGGLVWEMLECCPSYRGALFACRSLRAELPCGTVVPLQKFASMGSAMCFPIEAMVFFTIVVSTVIRCNPSWTVPKALSELRGKCSIFGDDIIIPKEYASALSDELEAFGLRVNRSKSFWTGKFRESCGFDWYDGVLVTPLYCKASSAGDDATLVSMVDLANKFYSRGYHSAAASIKRSVKRKLYRVPDDRFVGWTFSGKEEIRFNEALQRREFRTHIAVTRTVPVGNDGYEGLSDWFVRSLRSADSNQMRFRPKDASLKLKKAWMFA